MTPPPNKVVSGWRASLDSTDINKEDFLPCFPAGSAGKESTCNAGDLGLIPGLGRSPGEGKGYPPQYSGLENSMDCIAHGVTKSQTQLSDSLSSHGGVHTTLKTHKKPFLSGIKQQLWEFSADGKMVLRHSPLVTFLAVRIIQLQSQPPSGGGGHLIDNSARRRAAQIWNEIFIIPLQGQ